MHSGKREKHLDNPWSFGFVPSYATKLTQVEEKLNTVVLCVKFYSFFHLLSPFFIDLVFSLWVQTLHRADAMTVWSLWLLRSAGTHIDHRKLKWSRETQHEENEKRKEEVLTEMFIKIREKSRNILREMEAQTRDRLTTPKPCIKALYFKTNRELT